MRSFFFFKHIYKQEFVSCSSSLIIFSITFTIFSLAGIICRITSTTDSFFFNYSYY